ncbi:aconitate hydratase [Cedecea neteri]|uniref:Aconitate hydratase n=1 Tax=Cedecea neteri TaxID=158822 RepID=A0A291E5T5_9ENTR|nr:aconitate hydratase [Cedecea neteri]
MCCPTRYRAFTLQTAVSQEREERDPVAPNDNESEENRRARRIP